MKTEATKQFLMEEHFTLQIGKKQKREKGGKTQKIRESQHNDESSPRTHRKIEQIVLE